MRGQYYKSSPINKDAQLTAIDIVRKYFVFVIRVPFRCTIRLRIHRTTVLHPSRKSNLKISVMNYNRRAADDSRRLVRVSCHFLSSQEEHSFLLG